MLIDLGAGLVPVHDRHVYVKNDGLIVVRSLSRNHLHGLKSILGSLHVEVHAQLF
jgi:hypothetical protein